MNSYNECKAIVELDLDPIKVKLMHKESGESWTLEQASAVEAEYRRFLYLMKKYPSEMAAPSMDVDTFWHYHILDTMKYARDCEHIFGHFLHHFPYVGLRGEEDLVAHEKMGERMAELYQETFGEKYRASLIDDSTVLASTNETAPLAGATTAFSPRPATTAFSTRPAGNAGINVTAGARETTTAFSTRPVATAFSTRPVATAFSTRPVATAFSTRPLATAFSTRPAATAATAFSTRPATTAFSTRPTTTAFSTRPSMKQDETAFQTNSEATESSTVSAATVNHDDIAMNTFFLTRPRLPEQANAN